MKRELILLSPYRLPTHNTLLLDADDIAIFLNGYLALWHPDVLKTASGPPRIDTPYDHESPSPNHIYAVPESPPTFLPDDWEEKVKETAAIAFTATPHRYETIHNLFEQINGQSGHETGQSRAAPFFGIGLGYIVLRGLLEAMNHDDTLAEEEFWASVSAAAETEGEEEREQHLRDAAAQLVTAREHVYPSPIMIADLVVPEEELTELPTALAADSPCSLLLSGEQLQNLAKYRPELFEQIKAADRAGVGEICGGPFRDHMDALYPVESQLWNFRKGMRTYKKLLGRDISVFARRRFYGSPELPELLHSFGFTRAITCEFDEGVRPGYESAIVQMRSPSGRCADALVRKPLPADNAGTYFHLAYYLNETIMRDMSACLVLSHTGQPKMPFYRDWLELSKLSPVLGEFVPISGFFDEVATGEYPDAPHHDEFHSDFLHELTSAGESNPISRFSEKSLDRTKLDDAWTLLGMASSLGLGETALEMTRKLHDCESEVETKGTAKAAELQEISDHVAHVLSSRLLSHTGERRPGYLILNPTNASQPIPVELPGVSTPLPDPARVTQIEGNVGKCVLDVPAFGFSWLPRAVSPGTKVPMPGKTLAEDRILRNELLEVEIDSATGGIRAIRDLRRRKNRAAQQLVYGPGSTMIGQEIKIISSGPAVGEIQTRGDIRDSNDNLLAHFTQSVCLWWSRPLIEIKMEFDLPELPVGYPWHAYYAARFAWGSTAAHCYRAVNHVHTHTNSTRPESGDYFEVHEGGQRTAILLGGLPFLQRKGERMLDVILIPEGEIVREFHLGIALDCEDPIHISRQFNVPIHMIPTEAGPPRSGPTGWFFHIDVPNVSIQSIRPAAPDRDAVIVHLIETRRAGTLALLRCPRDPIRAALIDDLEEEITELPIEGDAIELDFLGGDRQRVFVEFGS